MIRKLFKLTPYKKLLDSYISAKLSAEKQWVKNEFNDFKKEVLLHSKEGEWLASALEERTFLVKHLYRDTFIKCYIDSSLCKMIYLDQFESDEIEFVKNVLNEGDVFIDIGANIGLFSLIASKLVGPSGRIIAFEPTPITFKRLEENLQLNELMNVDIYQLGISNCKKEEVLNISNEGYDAWNSLTKPSKGENFNKVTIQTDTLDNLSNINENICNASMIKIDVEGWESMVISGANKLLSKKDSPILMVEFTEQNAINAGFNTKSLYEMITKLGYTFYKYNKNKSLLKKEPFSGPYPYENLIALKEFHLDQVRLSVEK